MIFTISSSLKLVFQLPLQSFSPRLCCFAALSCLLSLILGKQCFSGDSGILPHYRLPCQMSSSSANYYSAVDAAIGQPVLFASHSFFSHALLLSKALRGKLCSCLVIVALLLRGDHTGGCRYSLDVWSSTGTTNLVVGGLGPRP